MGGKYRYIYKDGLRLIEHVLIAEKALGKPLPEGAVVHHHNEIRDDNRPQNLVICESQGYHRLIHARMRLIALGADPEKEFVCSFCQKVKPLSDFHLSNNRKRRINGHSNICKVCKSEYNTKQGYQKRADDRKTGIDIPRLKSGRKAKAA